MALQYFHLSPYKCHWFRHQEIFWAVLSTAAKWTALLPLLPACCTIIPLSVTYSLHVSSLPRAWNAWKGCTPLTQAFERPSSSRDRSSPTRLELGLGLCQKPTRNIPLSSLRWLSRQGVSRHLLSEPVSSLGKKTITRPRISHQIQMARGFLPCCWAPQRGDIKQGQWMAEVTRKKEVHDFPEEKINYDTVPGFPSCCFLC